jgi:hypothetical protein
LQDELFSDTIGGGTHEIDIDQTKEPVPGTSRSGLGIDDHHTHVDDGFGDEFGRKLHILIFSQVFG